MSGMVGRGCQESRLFIYYIYDKGFSLKFKIDYFTDAHGAFFYTGYSSIQLCEFYFFYLYIEGEIVFFFRRKIKMYYKFRKGNDKKKGDLIMLSK